MVIHQTLASGQFLGSAENDKRNIVSAVWQGVGRTRAAAHVPACLCFRVGQRKETALGQLDVHWPPCLINLLCLIINIVFSLLGSTLSSCNCAPAAC